jgi:hypothetical protein
MFVAFIPTGTGAIMMRSLLLLVLALGLVPGARCRPSAPPEPGDSIVVAGVIEDGVECRILHASDGRRYALAGGTGRFVVGDTVCVRGTIAGVSFCMAGDAVISVAAVTTPDSCAIR